MILERLLEIAHLITAVADHASGIPVVVVRQQRLLERVVALNKFAIRILVLSLADKIKWDCLFLDMIFFHRILQKLKLLLSSFPA